MKRPRREKPSRVFLEEGVGQQSQADEQSYGTDDNQHKEPLFADSVPTGFVGRKRKKKEEMVRGIGFEPMTPTV